VRTLRQSSSKSGRESRCDQSNVLKMRDYKLGRGFRADVRRKKSKELSVYIIE